MEQLVLRVVVAKKINHIGSHPWRVVFDSPLVLPPGCRRALPGCAPCAQPGGQSTGVSSPWEARSPQARAPFSATVSGFACCGDVLAFVKKVSTSGNDCICYGFCGKDSFPILVIRATF